MVLFGIEQFCSSEIICGKIFYRRFSSIFVRILQSVQSRYIASNILEVFYYLFLVLGLFLLSSMILVSIEIQIRFYYKLFVNHIL